MERLQPVVKGVDAKGELVWGSIPMPLWQQVMFPLRYVGDFIAFWMKRKALETWGRSNDDSLNMDDLSLIHKRHAHRRTLRKHHGGD